MFGRRRGVVEESSGVGSEGSSGLPSTYRLGVIARKGSRPLRVASMFADVVGCAGRWRLSLDWFTASPSDRALHLSNRCGVFAVRSTAVLPLFGFNSAPVLLKRTVFKFKAGASLQCHFLFQHRTPLRAHHPATHQLALFHVGYHAVGPESWPRTMIDRSSRMASFSARNG